VDGESCWIIESAQRSGKSRLGRIRDAGTELEAGETVGSKTEKCKGHVLAFREVVHFVGFVL
jgi:hypothetical protein